MVRVRPRSLGGPGEVPVVVRADVPLGTDRCAAARAPWSPSGDHAGYLLRKRHCGGQSGSPGEDGGVVVVLLDVVGEDRQLMPLVVVADGHLAHDILRRRGRNVPVQRRRVRLKVVDGVTGGAQLLDQLLDGEAECAELFLLHPERDKVALGPGDKPETAVARLADGLGDQHGEQLELVMLKGHWVLDSSRNRPRPYPSEHTTRGKTRKSGARATVGRGTERILVRHTEGTVAGPLARVRPANRRQGRVPDEL